MLDRTEVFDQSVMDEFEKARKLQEQLLSEHPGDRMLRENLGWTCILEEWRAHTLSPTPEQAGRQAIDIFRSLVAENPSDPFCATIWCGLCGGSLDTSSLPEALTGCERIHLHRRAIGAGVSGIGGISA